MEWLLEEAASHAAQTSWARMGYRRPSEARALILRGTGAGWASLSCARYCRCPRSTGLARQLDTPGGGRIGSTRGRRGRPGAPLEEVVRMAQEHCFPWRPEW